MGWNKTINVTWEHPSEVDVEINQILTKTLKHVVL